MTVFVALNTLFLFIYVLCAAVQYNDVDAVAWIAVYLSAAAMCASGFRQKPLHWLAPLVFLVSLGWMVILATNIVGVVSIAEVTASLSMQSQAVEEARELGGLAMVCFWAACITFRQNRGLREGS